jgi:hypothetical protein
LRKKKKKKRKKKKQMREWEERIKNTINQNIEKKKERKIM